MDIVLEFCQSDPVDLFNGLKNINPDCAKDVFRQRRFLMVPPILRSSHCQCEQLSKAFCPFSGRKLLRVWPQGPFLGLYLPPEKAWVAVWVRPFGAPCAWSRARRSSCHRPVRHGLVNRSDRAKVQRTVCRWTDVRSSKPWALPAGSTSSLMKSSRKTPGECHGAMMDEWGKLRYVYDVDGLESKSQGPF